MKSRKRKWALVICAFIILLILAVLLIEKSRPVEGTAIGISTMADGCVGYFFSVTNQSNRPLDIRLYRNEAPPKVSGVAIMIQANLLPKSEWRGGLYPPEEPVAWSATLQYFQYPSPLMKKLRYIASYLGFRVSDTDWVTAQTIQIEEGAK